MNFINCLRPSFVSLVSFLFHPPSSHRCRKKMSVNSHIMSFKYIPNIHIYPHILILKSELVVSVLLIIYIGRQVPVWSKTFHFKGDAEHGSENHPPGVADANVCIADPQGWVRWVLYSVTEYLDQVTANLRGDSERDLPDISWWFVLSLIRWYSSIFACWIMVGMDCY